MTRIAPARRVALELVSLRRRRDARMRDLLRSSKAMEQLDQRDRGLAARLALGVTATYGALDAMIDAHLTHGHHIEPRVRDALEIACYELCWLTTPAAIAVNQGVELVRSVAPRAVKLANALLRRVAQHDVSRVIAAERRMVTRSSDLLAKDVACACGMPETLAYGVLFSCGPEACRELALSQLEPAPVYVAANLAQYDEAEVYRRMHEAHLEVAPTPIQGAWEVLNPARLAPSGLVHAVVVVPVDLAAYMVARIASPQGGQRLLEVGQGRGTKTVLLQMVARESGQLAELSSIDVDDTKVRIAASRLARAGISAHSRSLAFDGRNLSDTELPAALSGSFDVVFLDAPCSGTGTMRRHPEIVWSLARSSITPHRPDSLPALQLDLLRACAARVRVGGTLVYATCSVLSQENEEVVEAFLASDEGRDFAVTSLLDAPGVTSLTEDGRDLIASCMTSTHMFRTHPRPGSFDGHFCARLVRQS